MAVHTPITELYMLIKDAGLIRRLMESKGLTARQISRDMGWASHSYMNRILGGKVRTVSPDAAVKMAYLLQVPVDLIFVPRVSGEIRHSAKGSAA